MSESWWRNPYFFILSLLLSISLSFILCLRAFHIFVFQAFYYIITLFIYQNFSYSPIILPSPFLLHSCNNSSFPPKDIRLWIICFGKYFLFPAFSLFLLCFFFLFVLVYFSYWRLSSNVWSPLPDYSYERVKNYKTGSFVFGGNVGW